MHLYILGKQQSSTVTKKVQNMIYANQVLV